MFVAFRVILAIFIRFVSLVFVTLLRDVCMMLLPLTLYTGTILMASRANEILTKRSSASLRLHSKAFRLATGGVGELHKLKDPEI